jgi:large subunit ribosomal protein L31
LKGCGNPGSPFTAEGKISVRDKIHPTLFTARVSCTCGNIFETLSTTKEIRVDICSACHPFFTGKQRLVDTAGRIEKFRKKHGLATPPAS